MIVLFIFLCFFPQSIVSFTKLIPKFYLTGTSDILANSEYAETNSKVKGSPHRSRITSVPSTVSMRQGNKNNDEDEIEEGEKEDMNDQLPQTYNVIGTPLCSCCDNVRDTGIGTGFYRNGYCSTGPDDLGRHTVCVQVTTEFLEFSKSVGNDLSTPAPQYLFPGLKDGDIWCLCAQRWAQAFAMGKAPKLYLRATQEKTLRYVPLDILRQYALDKDIVDRIVQSLNQQRTQLKNLFDRDTREQDDTLGSFQ